MCGAVLRCVVPAPAAGEPGQHGWGGRGRWCGRAGQSDCPARPGRGGTPEWSPGPRDPDESRLAGRRRRRGGAVRTHVPDRAADGPIERTSPADRLLGLRHEVTRTRNRPREHAGVGPRGRRSRHPQEPSPAPGTAADGSWPARRGPRTRGRGAPAPARPRGGHGRAPGDGTPGPRQPAPPFRAAAGAYAPKSVRRRWRGSKTAGVAAMVRAPVGRSPGRPPVTAPASRAIRSPAARSQGCSPRS